MNANDGVFNVIHRTLRWVSALIIGMWILDSVWAWFIPSAKTGTPLEWFLAWFAFGTYEVFENLAKWEREQQGLPPDDPNDYMNEPIPTEPLDTRVRALVAQGNTIEALRQIRREKKMSLHEAKEFLKRLNESI